MTRRRSSINHDRNKSQHNAQKRRNPTWPNDGPGHPSPARAENTKNDETSSFLPPPGPTPCHAIPSRVDPSTHPRPPESYPSKLGGHLAGSVDHAVAAGEADVDHLSSSMTVATNEAWTAYENVWVLYADTCVGVLLCVCRLLLCVCGCVGVGVLLCVLGCVATLGIARVGEAWVGHSWNV